jgi:DNA-binding response OmpR family regulator
MQSVCVLVIDDDPGMRTTLQDVFEEARYEVLLARDGAEGLRLCQSRRVDLVVTDVFMPGREGLETIQALRRSFANIPIIVMSGGGESGKLDMLPVATALGAQRAFRKPFDIGELLAAARELVSPGGAAR